MSQDATDGDVRKTNGRTEEIGGRAVKDRQGIVPGSNEQAAGNVQTAYGQAKDAIASGATEVAKDATATYAKARDAVVHGAKSAIDGLADGDFGALRDDLARLAQTVGELLQSQAASTRDQVMDTVGAAGDNVTRSAAAAQDKLVSLEADFEAWIKKNPLSAVAIALGLGFLTAKMTRFIK